MYYLIYKITNKLDNKFYVGKHKTDKKEDGYFGSGLLLSRAISKYGQENFVKEILHECENEEEMNRKEAEIVNKEFILRNDVYNLMIGGCGGFSYINETGKNIHENHSENSRKLAKLNFQDFKITKQKLIQEGLWEEYKKKVSSGVKKAFQKKEKFHWTGKTHKEESKKKIGAKSKIHQKGENNSQYGTRIIYNLETGKRKRIHSIETLPIGWIYSTDRVKVKTEKVKDGSSRKLAIQLHDNYLNSGCKSLREFCRNGSYNKSVQALIMFWKRNIPDIYTPSQGKSYIKK